MTEVGGQVGRNYEPRTDPAYLAAEARVRALQAADDGTAATDALAARDDALEALTRAVVTASEALAAGDLVNIWASGGAKARKANATDGTKPAHGFVAAAVANGAPATVYPLGLVNAAVAGLTPGSGYFLATTGGALTATAPATSGNAVQLVGLAVAATRLLTQAAAQTIVP